ncbi:MAG: hypothetical protein VKJ24_00185 [Synechococcales bacterium]|nr:hypothetical protein [Synechococcales bacterium]
MLTPKSGLLLGLSCIAAIAGVGCVFELSSGQPEWGSTTTWGILIGSVPICIAAFLAAVKDARANLGG